MPSARQPVLMLAAVVWLTLGAAAAQDRPAGVGTDFVREAEVSETVPVFAEVVANRESAVAARVAGVVSEVLVRVGDELAADGPIAKLDTELLEIALRGAEAAEAEARAGVEVAQAGVDQAQRGFARVEGLQGTAAFSRGVFEDREAELARAEGELLRARAGLLRSEAALAQARYDLRRSEITAPFAGVVLDVIVDPGEYIQTGAEVARLLSTTDIEVEAAVPAEYVGSLSVGVALDGQSDTGTPLDLTVRALLPTESTATRTRPVRFQADLSNGSKPVAIGQTVTVDIPITAPRQALLVPKDALTQARGAWQVFVHEDGKAVPRTVEIGNSFGQAFEVLSGLASGDEVVVRGNERLFAMQPIAPNPVSASPEASPEAGAGPAEEDSAVQPGESREQAAAVAE